MSISIQPLVSNRVYAAPPQRVRFGTTPETDKGDNPETNTAPQQKTGKGWFSKLNFQTVKDGFHQGFNNVRDMFRMGPTQSGRNIKLFLQSMAIHVTWMTLLSMVTSMGAVIPALPVLIPVYAGISASFQVVESFMRGIFSCSDQIKPRHEKNA